MVLSLQAFQRNIPEVSGTTHSLAMLLSRARRVQWGCKRPSCSSGALWEVRGRAEHHSSPQTLRSVLSPSGTSRRLLDTWVPLMPREQRFPSQQSPILMAVSGQGWAEPGTLAVWRIWGCMSPLQGSVDLAGIVWNKALGSLFFQAA